MTETKKIITLHTIAEQLFQNLIRAISYYHLLEAMNSQDVISRFDNTYASHGYNSIHDSLISGLLLCLTRVFDAFGHDRASLGRAFSLLDEEIQEVLAKKARNWNSGFPDRNYRRVKIWLRCTKRKYEVFIKSDCYLRIKDHRTHYVSHTLLKEDTIPTTYNDIFYTLNVAKKIIRYVRLSITGEDFDPNDYDEIWKEYSRSYWKTASE